MADAERNGNSNIRPAGLAPDAAARNLAWLVEAALALHMTGVALKDRSLAEIEAPCAATGLAAAKVTE